MIRRAIQQLRKHSVHYRAEETNYQLKSTPSGGSLVGITSRSQDDSKGVEVAVYGAELDSAGQVIRGGEINFKKIGSKESVESSGSDDPREILKAFKISVPSELKSLNFQVSGDTPSADKLHKFKK